VRPDATDATVTLHTGRVMPVLGLGTWELTRDTADAVEHALELGYRMIDTAVDYGSQPGIGQALARTDLPRERVYLVAKVEEDDDAYDATRRYLDEMRQDFADLILIHRPPPAPPGGDDVGHALWDGLARARDDGLARDIGVSNYSIAQLRRLADDTGENPAVNQVEWTPFGWSPEMLDYCRERRIVVQGWSPLTRAERLDDERLAPIVAEYDRSAAQILLRWAIQKGTVPLPKANQRQHQEENLGALEFELDQDHLDALDHLNEHWSALGDRLQYL
jgi:2,5-diketo-D-gluconate reductase A